MEKEKSELEQLLNSLIEKGWKPFGKRNKLYAVEDGIYILGRIASDWNTYDLRQLVSKESQLRQFCAENGMVKNEKLTHNWVSQVEWGLDVDCKRKTTPKDYEYRLIESSLKDESELESFILDNIKVGNED